MLVMGQRVRMIIEPDDPEPAWVGTIVGIVAGSERRPEDKVVYFVRWDNDQPGDEFDRRYAGEMEII